MDSVSYEHKKHALILVTGQTTSYATYDDGYYQKGLSKAYTVLTTGQYSGTTTLTVTNSEAHSNNVVIDRRTGIMWSRYASSGVGAAADGLLTWAQAFTYATAANSASLSGYTDWRIPNVLTLQSILDFEAPDAKPDATAFPSVVTTSLYWTSTTVPSATANAFAINMDSGNSASVGKGLTRRVFLARTA